MAERADNDLQRGFSVDHLIIAWNTVGVCLMGEEQRQSFCWWKSSAPLAALPLKHSPLSEVMLHLCWSDPAAVIVSNNTFSGLTTAARACRCPQQMNATCSDHRLVRTAVLSRASAEILTCDHFTQRFQCVLITRPVYFGYAETTPQMFSSFQNVVSDQEIQIWIKVEPLIMSRSDC